jgi:hypothetical protein
VAREKPKKSEALDKLCRSCHGNKKGGFNFFFRFLSSNFMKLCGSHFVQLIPIFLLVPLDVDVTGNITGTICEVWSEFGQTLPQLPWKQKGGI